ncbi:sterol desaturase family protein [Flavobacterium sp.]|uniref:sterol desaturase family protein n=1 Tax=Flavobacterium sp. TaxID=239 RepID=UPI0025C57DBA|nr:sterol desaturase family protein [Flavobacterium sp.]
MQDKSYFFFVLLMSLRYLVMAGLAFVIFYVLFRERFRRIKIQRLFPKSRDYYRELKFSMLTMLIFTAYAVVIFRSPVSGFTQLYEDISEFGIVYFLASVLVAIFVHDTYFYWTHRLMHNPKLFRIFHLVHHKSTNPSPWTAYSFHPLEAIVEGGVIVVIVFLFPIHRYAIGLFMLFMLTFNIYGHLGYELFPRWLVRSRVGRWLNTSTNHNMHHKLFNGNYGLYFRFWDILMGTTHPKYDETLNQIHSAK